MDVKKFYETQYGNTSSIVTEKKSLYKILYPLFGEDRDTFINRELQKLPRLQRLLDIGCGDGILLMKIQNHFEELWGIDISDSRISRFEEKIKNNPKIHSKVEDMNNQIGFDNGFFNIVTAIAILEHVFDPYSFMAECYRLCSKGGYVVIYVPNIASLHQRLNLLIGRCPVTSRARGWDGGHLHYFTKANLKKLFEDTGFEVVYVTHGGILASIRRFWGTLLCDDILMIGIKN